MQDIIFYAAANETLGMIRDYANERNSPAPVLTLGVSVCLRMRLFSSTEGATPYPIASLNGISDWQWCMDSDFDRDTACKLVADAGGISVHTETDTVNGETMSFTEFVIPVSNMNTEELAAWLGNEKMKPGLTGELVGYDSSGNAAFVLQIENFSVRNRVAGLGDPTVLDQEIVTRTQAELMIQTAVSASAAAKQDKLTSANAGVGISITSSGVISTANVPQSAVSGLPETLAAKQNSITAGYRMALVSGSTVDQARYFMIEPAITAPANNTTTVVLSAGKAYEIHAVANHAKVLLTRENPPSARTFGLEGHAEIFVANTGYIQTGSNVVLANALEPDAVNNCTVRFHDGLAIISVEDHVAGYIVVSATGSTAGTLPYALDSASQEYVAFDAALNGQTLDMGGAVTNSEKHIVGNGYTETILTGGVSCTNKTTFANLAMNDVSVLGGTAVLGDTYIPNGATVSVSGGGLAVERVMGNGGVIDLGGTHVFVSSGGTAYASGCTFRGGVADSAGGGGFYALAATLNASECIFSGNKTTSRGGAVYIRTGYSTLTSCTIVGNSGLYGAVFVHAADVTMADCTVSGNVVSGTSDTNGVMLASGASLKLTGSNTIEMVAALNIGGAVTLTSGTILNLTGNTNATPIAPGGGITFESDGATVLYDHDSNGSAMASSASYMIDNVTLPAGAKLTNTNVVNLGGSNVVIPAGKTATASGLTFTGGGQANMFGGAFICYASSLISLTSCTVSGNIASGGGGVYISSGGLRLSACNITSNTATHGDIFNSGGVVEIFDGCTIGSCSVNAGSFTFYGSNSVAEIKKRYSASVGDTTITSGAIVCLTGNSNPTPINPGGVITIQGGGLYEPTKIVYSSGGSVDSRTFEDLEIKGATITNLGLVYGATVYSLAGDDHEILYTEDDGATSSSVVISGETTYVVPGALVKVTNT